MSITSSRSSASMAESQTLSTTPPCFRGNQLNPSKMGTLRIEKGDVIICLSDKEEDRLLLDSQTIEQSKHLKASMRDDWNPRSVKKVPDDDEEDEKGKTIWQFGLVWLTNNASERDNGSYVLESGVSNSISRVEARCQDG